MYAWAVWMGWYGFNSGSQYTIADSASGAYVGLAAVNTTLGACAAAATYGIINGICGGLEIGGILNALLTGLVSVTANVSIAGIVCNG